MKTLYAPLIALTLLSGCATKREYQGFAVGRDYYARLDEKQKAVFDAGAEYATNDYMQRNYDVERRAMKHDLPGADYGHNSANLKQTLVPVLIPAHTDPEGIQHDPGYKVIEVQTVQ